jgi:hypothetical protein
LTGTGVTSTICTSSRKRRRRFATTSRQTGPLDQIRNKGDYRPGADRESTPGLHHVDEIVSSLYAYPITAFARIVAEDPSLQVVYGNDAIDYANRVIETVNFFYRRSTPAHRRLHRSDADASLEYRDKPTEADCAGRDRAKSEDPGNGAWDQKQRDCSAFEAAGKALPPINLTFSMVLVSSRGARQPFYLRPEARAAPRTCETFFSSSSRASNAISPTA